MLTNLFDNRSLYSVYDLMMMSLQPYITGLGQTRSVIELCKNLPESMKKYVLAKGVGHYGLFNGSKFREHIIPEMNHFITKQHISKRKDSVSHERKKTRS